jgi:hypothetical protein
MVDADDSPETRGKLNCCWEGSNEPKGKPASLGWLVIVGCMSSLQKGAALGRQTRRDALWSQREDCGRATVAVVYAPGWSFAHAGLLREECRECARYLLMGPPEFTCICG